MYTGIVLLCELGEAGSWKGEYEGNGEERGRTTRV